MDKEPIKNYKEAIRKTVVFKRVDLRTPTKVRLYYFFFSKYPEEQFFGKEFKVYLKQIQKIEKKAARKEGRPPIDEKDFYKGILGELSEHRGTDFIAGESPGKLLGYASLYVCQMRHLPSEILRNYAASDNIHPNDYVTFLGGFYPLMAVGEGRFQGRGVGRKALSLLFNDLKASFKVKWVYANVASPILGKMLKEAYSFRQIGELTYYESASFFGKL